MLEPESCPYPLSRKPETPALMPDPVPWCPGPGGCESFNEKDYSCELRLSAKPQEYKFKFASRSRVSNWNFTFNGKFIMYLGGAFILISVLYSNVLKGAAFLTGIFGLFGLSVFVVGYIMRRWETKPWGSSGEGDTRVATSKLSKKKLPDKNTSSPKIETAVSLDLDETDASVTTCPFFHLDKNHPLPCQPDCQYWREVKPLCYKLNLTSDCPYPLSRKPEAPGLMPEPVRWCPGPGGCLYFDEKSYVCSLKLTDKPTEFKFKFEKIKRNRLLGTIIMICGGALGPFLLIYHAYIKHNPYTGLILLFMGAFIALVGYVIRRWSS